MRRRAPSMRLARLAKSVGPVDVAVAFHPRARAPDRFLGGKRSTSARRTPVPRVVKPGTGDAPGPQRSPVAATPQWFADEQAHQQHDAQQGHGCGEQFFDHGVSAFCGVGKVWIARLGPSQRLDCAQSGAAIRSLAAKPELVMESRAAPARPGRGVTESRGGKSPQIIPAVQAPTVSRCGQALPHEHGISRTWRGP